MQQTYAASKGAIFSFTRSMAMSHGVFNINVNAIHRTMKDVALSENEKQLIKEIIIVDSLEVEIYKKFSLRKCTSIAATRSIHSQ